MPAPTVETMYWLPHCSTCQKAKLFLEDNGAKIKTIVDVKTESVPRAILQQLADAVGGPAQLFSKRALKFRAMGLHERELQDDEMLDLMHQEYTFIKRPVIVLDKGRKVLAGFSKKQYEQLLAGQPA